MLGTAGAVPLLPGVKGPSALDSLYPMFRGLASLFLAVLGMLLFGMVGSLAYPGTGAIVGAIAGLAFCAALGCCVTGFWRDLLPSNTTTFGAEQFLPHALAVQIGSHGHFDLVVTVNEVANVEVQGRMPWMWPELYAEVACGSNPVKRTCVRTDGKFNEQFKLKIAPTDDFLIVRLKDQDVFGSRDVGYVCVNIHRDILEPGFPWQKEFPIEAGEHDKLRWNERKAAMVVLSFDYTEDYPAVLRGNATAGGREESRKGLEKQWGSANYGAVNYLSKLEFNTAMKISQEDASLKA
uniref:C2 domain-containing protein n=1 Tax=Alexandrium monilatum TaxID=311494 RepID=A0A7S4S290_9DINO|mmetsp:Transcript_10024/g.29945  ORF Transcript_10024/g.29945 Transcript_10024/m.29945 type:complete len:294 (-) Transcript_10024:60-941(-)